MWLDGKRAFKLSARPDPELREHLVQMPFDRARAEEQLLADLRVRQAVASKRGDLALLFGEFVTSVDVARAPSLPSRTARGRRLGSGYLHL